jgi:methyl-accepting chemotaxis protein
MRQLDMKVGTRLGAGFVLVLGLGVSMAGFGIYTLSQSRADTRALVQGDVVKLAAALRLDSAARANGRRLPELLAAREKSEIDQLLEHIATNSKAAGEALGNLETLVQDDDGKKRLAAISDAASRYNVASRRLAHFVKNGRIEEGVAVFKKDVSPALDAYTVSIVEIVKLQEAALAQAVVAGEGAFTRARNMLLGLAGLMVMLGAVVSWLVARSITRPLSRAVGLARKVAAGDLTATIEVKGRDETAQLLRALAEMNESLRKIVSEVRGGVDAISEASKEMAAGNADLSHRTDEQASSLQQTAASMEQLAHTVRQNADNAQHANSLAAAASEVAVKGGTVVSAAVQTMSSINESSRKIADIIGVIDSIAFQTNILALNAAVEAARAGEQGRGFAVVASEVRRLAQRSAGAAQEIKQVISESVGKVEDGTRLVDEAGKRMDEIVQSVQRVTDIIGSISAASAAQTSGIEQVNRAVAQMDQTTQQNAALVEQAAAAAEAMQEQAEQLSREVSVFRIDAAHTPSAEAPVRAAGEQSPAPAAAKPVHMKPARESDAAAWSGFTPKTAAAR